MGDKPVALVTGAAKGIGAATAIQFARCGYDLSLLDCSGDKLKDVASQIQATGGTPLTHVCDLFHIEDAQNSLQQTIAYFGRLDVLVNNAAVAVFTTMRLISLEDWERSLRVNLTTPMFLAKWAAEQMARQGKGVIINVSSLVSRQATGCVPAYQASKGGLDAMTYELAVLFGPSGIRVVAINPGAIDTEMSRQFASGDTSNGSDEEEALRKYSEDIICLGRWGTADEIARSIVWLASDDASYITGTTILVDGGWHHNHSPYSIKRMAFPLQFRGLSP
ncbi:MAG: SDR family oxidoreductase [Acidobacteria bacterium]|nr:SDR family oxidoreductase [Acidobacteriota bacterium]MCI0719665.1 SDR family oxidoreductase [Acidobacteriota bacterium]